MNSKILITIAFLSISFISEAQELFSSENDQGKWGFVDTSGKEVIPFIYDKADCFYMGYAGVSRNGKMGLIDLSGKEIVPFLYDNELMFFEDGMALVIKDNLYGFVDTTGKVAIPLIYEDAEDFKSGKAKVMKDGEWIFINKKGETIKEE